MVLFATCLSQVLISRDAQAIDGCSSTHERQQPNAGTHATIPFSVKDSIEISRIINPVSSTVIELREEQPVGKPLVSPDKKHFLLISQRGVLATNALEATIWLFDLRSVSAYVSGRACRTPVPIPVARLAASSNTPVVSNVKWIDSRRVAFLGKQNSPYQQLFIADVITGVLRAVTRKGTYVTAYDIRNATIAYTALEPPDDSDTSQGYVMHVDGKDISALLYPKPPGLPDVDEGALMTYPNVLHVEVGGHELTDRLIFDGQPLRLYVPTLSLSPDGLSLITVAPVRIVPQQWQHYSPAYAVMDFLRLTPRSQYAVSQKNPWKASQYIIVNLKTRTVSPLVDAPAGRGLVFTAPTTAFWFPDGGQAIVTNTLMPINERQDYSERKRRTECSFAAWVDVRTRHIEEIAATVKASDESGVRLHVTAYQWNEAGKELTLEYGGDAENIPSQPVDVCSFNSGKWGCNPGSGGIGGTETGGIHLLISQDLNQPPVLTAHTAGGDKRVLLWDPNPQLARLKASTVSLYHWRDERGKTYSGLLALPPDYRPGSKYPLVIQTHGYHASRYFADGEYTTGSGGRALCARGIVVLQAEDGMEHGYGPEEGPDHIEEYRSAIDQLSSVNIVDRTRVGIIGFSRSCFHVLYTLTHEPELFEAATITDGVNLSYVEYLFQSPANQRIAEIMNGGLPFGADLSQWAKRAPGFNVDKVSAPLLIFSLERETMLLQWEIYAGLRILKKPADMIWLRRENAPHILVKPRERYVSQETSVDWFDFWLNGHEDPDPAKVEQYKRWRSLQLSEIHNLPSSQ